MWIAVPSESNAGLAAPTSNHFGHSAAFTLVQVADGQVGEVKVVANDAHEQGGCASVVNLLAANGAELCITGGMGMRPLQAFAEAGIPVLGTGGRALVSDVVDAYIAGELRPFGQDESCDGDHDHGHGHHHGHAPVERPPLQDPVVAADRVVSLHYTLTSGEGDVIDTSQGRPPLKYLHGHGQIVPGLEGALDGMRLGESKQVKVPAAEGYGERDEAAVFQVPRHQLPEDIAVGMQVQGNLGEGRTANLTITSITKSQVTLDANHSLAGHDLHFDVSIAAVEAATPEEIAHGHVH